MTDTTTVEESYKLPPRPPRKLGSDGWRSASYKDEEDEKKIMAFFDSVKWERLANMASDLRGVKATYPTESFALGHRHMVRRLTFVDGVDWVVRVYLTYEDVSPNTIYKSFNREVAAAAFLR